MIPHKLRLVKYDLHTHKPIRMGLSQTQSCIILALANNSPHRPTSHGKQEVGGMLGSDSEGPCCSYSDVAALRPPSPTLHTVDEIPIAPHHNYGLDKWANDECTSTVAPIPVESSIMDMSRSDGNEHLWTTVEHRCMHSSRFRINKKFIKSIDNTQKIIAEAESAVQQAEQALTVAQKEKILCRHTKGGLGC